MLRYILLPFFFLVWTNYSRHRKNNYLRVLFMQLGIMLTVRFFIVIINLMHILCSFALYIYIYIFFLSFMYALIRLRNVELFLHWSCHFWNVPSSDETISCFCGITWVQDNKKHVLDWQFAVLIMCCVCVCVCTLDFK